MSQQIDTVNVAGEKRYEHVFGDTFAMYSNKEMVEFIEPFRVRFIRNNIDARKVFEGKNCFDGGCGNGRGTLFMLMNGANHVTSFDFSETNIQSTQKFTSDFGFSNVTTVQGTLENIQFPDEAFDFVWCNGVVMHADHPNKCLAELARILKTGGQSWIYIYGSGGVYWRMIYHFRDMMRNIHVHECISLLKILRYETRYIAEFIDDWYATNLRTYTDADLSARLAELGFESPSLLPFGMDYDTSHRLNTFTSAIEQDLMGDGDLRYLLTKVSNEQTNDKLLLEGEYGSDYPYPDVISQNIDPLMEELKEKTAGKSWLKIASAAHIQRELRLIMTEEKMFSLDDIISVVRNVLNNIETITNF